MSGETEESKLSVEINALEKLMMATFAERELRYSQRFDEQEEGLKDLARTTDNRFFSHNEFRKEALKRDELFATKIEVQNLFMNMTDLKDRISRVEILKEGQTKTLMSLVTIIGVVLVIINIVSALFN